MSNINFPQAFNNILKAQRNITIAELPVLKPVNWPTAFITVAEMDAPIMQFKDSKGRQNVALLVRPKYSSLFYVVVYNFLEDDLLRLINKAFIAGWNKYAVYHPVLLGEDALEEFESFFDYGNGIFFCPSHYEKISPNSAASHFPVEINCALKKFWNKSIDDLPLYPLQSVGFVTSTSMTEPIMRYITNENKKHGLCFLIQPKDESECIDCLEYLSDEWVSCHRFYSRDGLTKWLCENLNGDSEIECFIRILEGKHATLTIPKIMLPFPLNNVYHADIISSLQNFWGLKIKDVPELDLKERYNDYIDFIVKKDLSAPIMRFRDKVGRYGLALFLRSKDNTLSGVLAFHQGNSSFVWAGHDLNQVKLKEKYEQYLPKFVKESKANFPPGTREYAPNFLRGQSLSREMLISLLRGLDPVLYIPDSLEDSLEDGLEKKEHLPKVETKREKIVHFSAFFTDYIKNKSRFSIIRDFILNLSDEDLDLFDWVIEMISTDDEFKEEGERMDIAQNFLGEYKSKLGL